MGFGITFSPLVPNEILWACIAVAAVAAVLLLVIRSRGAWIRALALGFGALTLANPSLTREDREALPSVAVVVVDKSPSQLFGDRDKQTEAVRAAVTQRLNRIAGLEVRVVEAGQADGETDGTRLFSALGAALSDVPPDRVAGTLFITDGRVHDVPAEAAQLGFNAPVHALITGRPGERTWRNLLKSDASVDLVHFTILRPPEKQDGTPINELSLIAFPTRELFQQKINEFHLIIFDRYARQGVLPVIYFDNIARYVREGGAVLVAAGPDYASPTSIWRTPLDVVLPAEPSGRTTEIPYFAQLTDLGKRHPVTRGLEGAESDPPHWSQWFRLVDARTEKGTPVRQGPDDNPLLLLSREGEGRVALLLSDHIWLWARGHEGGGPHLDLLRRLSHWLMKQPDLEEEALRLAVHGKDIEVRRQSMADEVAPVTITTPSGQTRTLTLDKSEPGVWKAVTQANELGLWGATDGKLTALVNVRPANPREYAEVTSSTNVLGPFASATGGDARRIADASGNLSIPRVLAVRSTDTYKGDDWLGLKMRDASVVRGIGVLPLFAGMLGLLLLIGSHAATPSAHAATGGSRTTSR